MQLAISTACLYPMPLEESLATLIFAGFRKFEVFINTFSELKDGYLRNFRKIAAEKGGSFCSVHPFTSGYENFLFFSEYLRRFDDSLEFYRSYLNACNLLGADILVLHGRRTDKNVISDDEFFERYLKLYELGQSFGVTVAQENVFRFCSETPDFIRAMRAACGDRCAFVLDIKQAVRAGEDPLEMCGAMGEKLRQVHINDHTPSADCLLPGCGTMDYRALALCLKQFGYRGCLTIEVYRKNFGKLAELQKAKETVERVISSLSEGGNVR